jgi:hypothetical protein
VRMNAENAGRAAKWSRVCVLCATVVTVVKSVGFMYNSCNCGQERGFYVQQL